MKIRLKSSIIEMNNTNSVELSLKQIQLLIFSFITLILCIIINQVASTKFTNNKNQIQQQHQQQQRQQTTIEKYGPEFIVEPPNSVIFLNDTGTIITCSAKGIPSPTMIWTRSDGTILQPIPGLRQIRKDLLTTQLVYLPFAAASYRQDVHSGIVRCVATNQVGSIQSQDVHIRASVRQSYEIQVYDDFAIEGNTGVLRCHVPSFAREYVHITNWLHYNEDEDDDDNDNGNAKENNHGIVKSRDNNANNNDRIITSNLLEGGRYSIMPNGDLHVHRIYNDDNTDDNNGKNDINNNKPIKHKKLMFRCQTKHMLNGMIKLSANYGRLIVTKPQTKMPPKIMLNNSGRQKIIAKIGQTIELPCVAQAQPWPTFIWFRNNNNNDKSKNDLQLHQSNLITPVNRLERLKVSTFQVPSIDDINNNDKDGLLNAEQYITPYRLSRAGRMVQVDSSLFIRDVNIADSGLYVCVANNSLGEDRVEIELIVKAPLSVIMTPSHIIASDGDTINFNCTITGGWPIQKIHWRRNARPLITSSTNRQHSNHRVHLLHQDRLLQIRQVRREDRGMFQCIVSNEFESVQASGELALTDDPPSFISVFTVTEPLRPGKPLSIKCSATGTPLPQIVWTLDGAPLIEHGRIRVGDYVSGDGVVNSFVNISSLRTEDGGIYSCTASNDVHSISHSGRINVYGPAFVRQMKNITAIAGHTVHLHCPAAGYPLESIVWYKKSLTNDHGSRLPQNHRHKSLLNGTLVIEKIERSADEGTYRCVVTGPNGASSASAELYIRVLIAPVISPFNPPPNLRENMRVMLTCSVVEGDSPILIQFLKDGEPIHDTLSPSASRRIKLDVTNEFSATLFISSVTAEDSGNYTCIASNMAAVSIYSIVVKVNVPPKWKIPPADTEAIEGHNVIIDCSASGEPRIWWERAHDKAHNMISSSAIGDTPPIVQYFRTLVSNSHMHTLENGSLMIRDVTEEDSGVYLCQANNGVGSGLSKVITLKVHVPAHFKSKFSAHTAQRGESIEFSCDAYGELPVSIQIAKDRMPLDFGNIFERLSSDPSLEQQILRTDNRYHLLRRVTDETDRAITSYILRISNVDRRDSSLFTCLASNKYGKDEFNFQLIIQEPPSKPENVHIVELDSRSAVIAWSQPYSGNSPVIAFHVEYRQYSESLPPWHHLDTSTANIYQNEDDLNPHQLSKPSGAIFRHTLVGTESSISLRSLKPMTTYEIRVQAENKLGMGPFTMPPLKITTKEEAPSGPPLNIHVFPSSAHSLQVNFQPPRIEHQNGQILGYYVGYKAVDLDEHFMFKKVVEEKSIQPSGASKEVKISDLRRATKYLVIVQAFNRIGPGPQSEEVIGETLVNDPPRAPILTSVNVDYDSVELSWSIETTDNAFASEHVSDVPEITGYFLYAKSSLSNEWEERQVDSQQNSFTFTNLLCGTQYQFYVIAYNNVGKGDPSQAIAVRTKGSVPIAPKNWNSFITTNSTTAVIRLDAWLVNGCEIKYFILKYRPRMDSEWLFVSSQISPREQRFVELVDLRPATWYLINMAALTDIGTTEETYMFSTLTLDGETIPPIETISRTLTSANSISASSGTVGSSNWNSMNSMQSLTIVIPATCSVIVLTVIIVVACFISGTKHHRSSIQHQIEQQQQQQLQNQQQYDDTLIVAHSSMSNTNNGFTSTHPSITNTPLHQHFDHHQHHHHQSSEQYCTPYSTTNLPQQNDIARYCLTNVQQTPQQQQHLPLSYGFCVSNDSVYELPNVNTSAKFELITNDKNISNNDIELSNQNLTSSTMKTYATLKKRRSIQNEPNNIDNDNDDDCEQQQQQSYNELMMTTCLDSQLICDKDDNNNNIKQHINNNNHVDSIKLPQSNAINSSNHHNHGILQQANNTTTKNILSPMIWLLVGWWKLNLMIF